MADHIGNSAVPQRRYRGTWGRSRKESRLALTNKSHNVINSLTHVDNVPTEGEGRWQSATQASTISSAATRLWIEQDGYGLLRIIRQAGTDRKQEATM